VQDKCRQEEPPLLPGNAPGHEYRCWFPVGTPEGRAALERNRAAGIAPPAAGISGNGEATAPTVSPTTGGTA
jgi:peptide/nickel transport system ATP-binding protein